MTVVQALILSIVEGITEFLPVSSTGHMILVSALLRIPETDFVKSFEIIIQLGAILAVVTLYWKKLFAGWRRVFIAFFPTAVIGLLLYKLIKTVLLGNPWIVVWSFAAGGVALLFLEKFLKMQDKPITASSAFLIGVSQSLSVVPGVSRSAATIAGALLLGISRESAVEFSFLLAIPTMAAATGLDLLKSGRQFTGNQYELLGIGFTGAFITALLTVKWFIAFVKTHSFVPFAWYRIFAALAFYLFILK